MKLTRPLNHDAPTTSREASRSGSVLVTVIIFVMVLAGLGSSMLRVDLSISNSRRSDGAAQRAYFAAESGIDEAFILLRSRLLAPEEGDTVTVGSEQIPRTLANSSYWAEVTRLDAWRFQVIATGACDDERKRQECVFTTAPDGFFQYAAFARDGLSLGDGSVTNSYDPTLGTFASQSSRGNGGVGANGNVTLGGNTLINGDAVTGEGGSIIENGANVVITGDRGLPRRGHDVPAHRAARGHVERSAGRHGGLHHRAGVSSASTRSRRRAVRR